MKYLKAVSSGGRLMDESNLPPRESVFSKYGCESEFHHFLKLMNMVRGFLVNSAYGTAVLKLSC